MPLKTIILTALTLIAFAANSVLCRLALGDGSIDAAGFTVVRLFSGAVALMAILAARGRLLARPARGSWLGALMLFSYATCFSLAYVSLNISTGALILFAAGQVGLIGLSIIMGNRLLWVEWLGMALALSGLVYLLLPGVATPPLLGFVLMAAAGFSWAVYTLAGRGSQNPLADTAYNFLRTMPLVLVALIIASQTGFYTGRGLLLAAVSGAITSGMGYVIWYSALQGLNDTQAAVVQLSTPVIAAAGGVVFMSEAVTWRLTVSAAMILGGILVVVLGRWYLGAVRK